MKIPAVVLMEETGCFSCHTLKDSEGELIPLKGLFGQKKVVIKDTNEVTIVVDEAYLRRALMEPGLELIKGQANMMEPVEDLTEEQIKMIIQFLVAFQ